MIRNRKLFTLRKPGFGRFAGRCSDEQGLATLIALIALSVFGLISLYMMLNSSTEARISDNQESAIQAGYAARAGLNHAREAIRGAAFDDLLKGPNGTADTAASTAQTIAFRNPLSWSLARSLNISDPASDLTGIVDDGLLNSGKVGTTNGTLIVPLTGIAVTAPNPYGSGTINTSRYFVRITDNNGEAGEDTDPFHDADGIIIVRSMGVAQTIRETAGGVVRSNSVAVAEAKFKRDFTFDLKSPVVVDGPSVVPSQPNMYDGNSFQINGGSGYGIGTVPLPGGSNLNDQLTAGLSRQQTNNITGAGANPSIGTMPMNDAQQQANLQSPSYLYNFANSIASQADAAYEGDQNWHGGDAPPLGTSAVPRLTYVNGNLDISGDVDGYGTMVIRGALTGNGRFRFTGLVLIIGAGDLDLGGLNHFGITGGIFVANVSVVNGTPTFGSAHLTVSGQTTVTADGNAVSMGMRQLASKQMGWREVKSDMDP